MSCHHRLENVEPYLKTVTSSRNPFEQLHIGLTFDIFLCWCCCYSCCCCCCMVGEHFTSQRTDSTYVFQFSRHFPPQSPESNLQQSRGKLSGWGWGKCPKMHSVIDRQKKTCFNHNGAFSNWSNAFRLSWALLFIAFAVMLLLCCVYAMEFINSITLPTLALSYPSHGWPPEGKIPMVLSVGCNYRHPPNPYRMDSGRGGWWVVVAWSACGCTHLWSAKARGVLSYTCAGCRFNKSI